LFVFSFRFSLARYQAQTSTSRTSLEQSMEATARGAYNKKGG
jgi:hypothetical protein